MYDARCIYETFEVLASSTFKKYRFQTEKNIHRF